MTREAVKALTDAELQDVGVWVLELTRERKEERRKKAIADIKAIAAAQGIPVKIDGQRGRPKRAAAKT